MASLSKHTDNVTKRHCLIRRVNILKQKFKPKVSSKKAITSTVATTPQFKPHSSNELEKWFDDGQLEDSKELQTLSQHVSEITIQLPDRNFDPELADLVNSANNPSHTRKDQKDNLDLLQRYIEHLAQEKDAKELEKAAEAKRKQKDSEDRQEKRSPSSRKACGIANRISQSMKNAFSVVLAVLKGGINVLSSLSFLAAELTFQTHYEVALKAILLLITAYDSANGLTAEITSVFDRMGGYVEEMTALQEHIKSRPMSKAISRFFLAIVTFIVSAGSYLKHGILSKMVEYLSGGNDKFNDLIKGIREAYGEVRRVMEFAQVMMNVKSLRQTSKISQDTAVIIRQLELLNSSFPSGTSTRLLEIYDSSTFHAELHIQSLRAHLFKTMYEPSEEMELNNKERIFLSPGDRWQRQLRQMPRPANPSSSGVIMSLRPVPRPLVWITGHVSRRNVSWVSSFSVDFIPYFREFSNFDVAYSFCKRGRGTRYTPTLLIKGLVSQLLDMHPTIATRNLRRLSVGRFQEIGLDAKPGSASLAWELLDDLLRLMEEAHELRRRAVLLLVDRLDLCVSEDDFSVMNDLIPRLQILSHRRRNVQVIVTTARIAAFSVPSLRRGPEWLQAYGKVAHR